MVRTLSQLLPRANKVVNVLRLRSKAFICGGWFREDGLRGQSLNMVLTIITIKTNTQYCLSYVSQINNIIIKQTLTVKGPRKVIIKLLKLGCPSTYFQLSSHILQQRPLYKISGVPICIQWPLYWYSELISLLCDWSMGRAFSLSPLKNFSTTNTMQRSNTIIKISFNH